MNPELLKYVLQLADNNLILGQRLGEWCGHGPVLEQDIALTNISLDLIGQARLLYQYAAKLDGGESTEDTMAYLRKEHEYRNLLLTEQANGDFAQTIARQFFYDTFNFLNYSKLLLSTDETLRALAQKSIKEVTYHLRYSSEWVVRLGDGTKESHRRMQQAVDLLWPLTGEMFIPEDYESALTDAGISVDIAALKTDWEKKVDAVLQEATLQKPEATWMQSGGKRGVHSEQMGYILAELQYMQHAYPGLEW